MIKHLLGATIDWAIRDITIMFYFHMELELLEIDEGGYAGSAIIYNFCIKLFET